MNTSIWIFFNTKYDMISMYYLYYGESTCLPTHTKPPPTTAQFSTMKHPRLFVSNIVSNINTNIVTKSDTQYRNSTGRKIQMSVHTCRENKYIIKKCFSIFNLSTMTTTCSTCTLFLPTSALQSSSSPRWRQQKTWCDMKMMQRRELDGG